MTQLGRLEAETSGAARGGGFAAYPWLSRGSEGWLCLMHGAHHRGAGWHYGFHPQQHTIDENEETPVPSLKLPREVPRAISANQPTTAADPYFDSKLALVDSASSAHEHHFAGGAAEDSEQMEAMDLAALGRLLPDLDGDSEQHQPSSAGRPPAAAPGMAAAAGAPGSGGRGGLRRRVGSTASVEEDIFSSVGGLELGHDLSGPDAAGSAAAAAAAEQLLAGASSAAAGSLSVPSVASLADLAPVDTPSRTLFVQNVAVDVPDDELRRLFSSHGDLRTLYTACKARGLVIVGYFDLRSAIAAATQLSGYPLAGRQLEVAFSAPKKGETNQVNQGVVVVYNLDPDTTEEQLVWIFSRFGDVKDIQQAPIRSNQKFIEFWDVRHAAAALRAMNRAELSRLPAPGRSLGAGAAAGGSSSGLAGLMGQEQEVSPPLSLGPLSQSWDTSGQPGSLMGLLNRQQQQQQQQQQSGQQQLGQQHGQQQQQQQSMLQQQQQQLLLQQLASGLLRGSRTDLSGLDPVIETDNGEALQKLLMGSSSGAAAAAAAGAAGAAAANAARPSGPAGNTGMHVSDSASSIASTQGNVFGAGMATGVLPGGARAPGVHSIHHGPFGPQLQSAAAAAASAAAAAAAGGSGIPRGASTGSLTGLGDNRGHRGGGGGGDSGAGSSGGSRGGGRLSRRAADPAVEAERKAQQERLFALDVDRIMSGEDKRTTLMIKNIPNKYTQKMLLQTIEEQFKGTFDFFYLPIDFKNKCNVGYAFINMLQPQFIPPLVARFNNKRWDKFNSEKVCNISYGRIQGRAALISHFQNSSLMHEDKRCRPVLFISEGPDAGEPEPFPMGVHARPRGACGPGGGSGSGGGSSGHLASERSPRVSSSGTISASGSGAGGSLAGSRASSSAALASAAAAGGGAQQAGDHGLASSSSHGGSGGGLAAAGTGDGAAGSGTREMQAPPPGLGAAKAS
ncbi:hypothetical protein OEZ86_006871 [Tetradesmus obliquus]|nr:hypothetical protein OEZ86_006871 [Tetradesmus obliquus]